MNAAEVTSLLGYMLVCSFTPGPGNILVLNTAGKIWLERQPTAYCVDMYRICNRADALHFSAVRTCTAILTDAGSAEIHWRNIHGLACNTYHAKPLFRFRNQQ